MPDPDANLSPLVSNLSQKPSERLKTLEVDSGDAQHVSGPLPLARRPGALKGRPKTPGSGKPKGYKAPTTISKEKAKEVLRQMVMRQLGPLVRAQVDSARGIAHFMLRDSATGQFRRLTEPREIEEALNAPGAAEGSTYWIYTKDPSIQAFTDLMNRALGKPTEEVEMQQAVTHTIRWEGPEMAAAVKIGAAPALPVSDEKQARIEGDTRPV